MARTNVGRVVGPRGLRGELRIRFFRPDPSYLDASQLILEGDGGERSFEVLEGAWVTPDTAVVQLDGIGDRAEAERWTKAMIAIDTDWFEAGEGPSERLVGARVVDDADDRPLGIVSRIGHNGAQELLILGEGEAERMIPLVDAFVARIDTSGDAPVIRLKLIPGLLED